MSKEMCECKALRTMCTGNCKLKEPKLNYALRHVHCMQDLQSNKFTGKETKSNPVDSTCQITKMLNFRSTETVFKNLIPLNVNDSFLLPKEKISLKKAQCGNNVPMPNLCDFLEPLEPLVNIILEPEINPQHYERDVDICHSYYAYIE